MVRPKYAPFHNLIFLVTEPYGTYDNGGDHRGTDLAPYSSQDDGNVPVYSIVSNGYVISTGYEATMGNYVTFKDNNSNYAFRYMHLKDGSINVKSGDTLNLSTRIGIMGETGTAYGRHLHVEARIMTGGSYEGSPRTNPNEYMGIKNVSYKTEFIEYYYEYESPPIDNQPIRNKEGKFKWALIKNKNIFLD